MDDNFTIENDINMAVAGGPAKIPEIQFLLVSENSWQPGYASGPHTGDPTWVALVTTEGVGHLWLDDTPKENPIVVKTDTLILFREERLMEYKAVRKQWVNHWYQFEIDGPWILPQEQVLSVQLGAGYRQQFTYIHQNIAHPAAAKRRGAAAQLTAILFRWIEEANLPPSDWDQNHPVQKAVDLMREHLHTRISMDEISKKVGLTDTQLRKVFMRDLRATPAKYYSWMRMYEARRLLVVGTSVGEVAELMQYSDQFHFTRAFKSHFARSPSQVMRDLKLEE